MAKKQINESLGLDLGPMPTLNELKNRIEKNIIRANASFNADWFLGLVERHSPEEAPHVITVSNSRVWKWPYQQRVTVLLNKFIKADQKFKDLIIAAREDKIFWRGDDRDVFVMVINETERMRSMGVVKYREEVKDKMRNFKMGKPDKAIQEESKPDYLQDLSEGKI